MPSHASNWVLNSWHAYEDSVTIAVTCGPVLSLPVIIKSKKQISGYFGTKSKEKDDQQKLESNIWWIASKYMSHACYTRSYGPWYSMLVVMIILNLNANEQSFLLFILIALSMKIQSVWKYFSASIVLSSINPQACHQCCWNLLIHYGEFNSI